ncbi:MAG: MBL fold metallo-hydrolase [Rhodospirillales bacterium]|nr:MBL fold metallo-hydrolase [Rhodospirillales bacterium]
MKDLCAVNSSKAWTNSKMLKYLFSLFLLFCAVEASQPVAAQQKNTQIRLPCGTGLVQNKAQIWPATTDRSGLIHTANLQASGLKSGQLSLTFVGHSTFLIQSPQGVKVITDYNDYFRAGVLPDIATMNVQRGNHSTDIVSPTISHVLRGWTEARTLKRHDVTHKDVRVYNLPTNITDFGVGFSNFSSIFIIQSQGLCIAHMGHLRHILDPQQFSKIGQIDVLLVPIDRRFTQSYDELVHNIKGINPRLLIPMHYNAMGTAEAFLTDIAKIYPVRRSRTPTLMLSRTTLPVKTEVLLISSQRPGGKLGSPL